ncbi:MAG TPA: hypothetical protein VNY73_01740 [Bacteroidia bacterium]|jgi:hypothetical protein|nr:hypothetical protein [Bacteroidia bacterium]
MLRSIRYIILAFAVFYLLFVLVFVIVSLISYNKNSSTYLAAFHDKITKAGSIKKKKIIITGGSGCAFGINSKRIKDSTQYEVINLGLHADINYKFFLSSAFDVAQSGDVIVFIPEYELTVTRGNGYLALFNLLSINPQYFKYCGPEDYCNFPFYGGQPTKTSLSKMLLKSFNVQEESFYYRSAFNEDGDLTSHLGSKSNWKNCSSAKKVDIKGESGYFVDYINSFHAKCQEKNITFFFSYPAIAASTIDAEYMKEFTKEMKACESFVMNDANRYFICDSLFIGTNYHLTANGREVRTSLLIEDLKNKLK